VRRPLVLERLAERLHRVASELGQLVEELDAVMRECSGMFPEVIPSPWEGVLPTSIPDGP
jgi:hypothetical protein